MMISSISPSTIPSTGGVILTLIGNGFNPETTVEIESEISCDFISLDYDIVAKEQSFKCNVAKGVFTNIAIASYEIVVRSIDPADLSEMESKSSISVDPKLDPIISSLSPTRGGSAGGTRLTITGQNFDIGTGVTVTIHGVVCDVQSVMATQIVCETNSYAGEKGGLLF